MIPDRRRRAVVRFQVLALTALIAAACGQSSPPVGGGSGGLETRGVSSSGASGSSAPSAAASGDVAPYGGSGPMTLADMTAGLATAGSYRAALQVTFESSDVVGRAWTLTSTLAMSSAASEWSLRVEASGETAPLAPATQAQVEGRTYGSRADGTCDVKPADAGGTILAALAPAKLLPSVVGAQPAGPDTVNGVAADHFTFGAEAIGLAGVADGTGEVWVATTRGFVVKEKMSLRGSGLPFGENGAGAMTFAYDVTDAGSAVEIALPPTCDAAPLDVPTPADATNVQRGPHVIRFATASGVAAVVAFYKEAGTRAGWAFDAPPYAAPDRGLVEARLGSTALTILVAGNGSGSSVVIVEQ